MKTIQQLRDENIPTASAATFGLTVAEGEGHEEAKAIIVFLDKQLSVFVKPVTRPNSFATGNVDCIRCEEPLGGMLGSFTWGLAHGEGFCRRCKYPARALHYLKDEAGENIMDGAVQAILQYHPSNVEIPPDERFDAEAEFVKSLGPDVIKINREAPDAVDT